MQEGEKIAAIKPVATRPFLKSGSVPKLLPTAETAPPSSATKKKTAAIKPKAVRLRLMPSNPTPETASFKDEAEAEPPCLSDNASASAVLHKLEAEFFSSSSLLSLEDIDAVHQENQTLDEIILKAKSNANNQPLQVDTMPVCESSNLIHQNMELGLKAHRQSSNGDKYSSDGYNWRKYGQKLLKGSEHPRSYYKCSYPKCPVKKKVERSLDGQIAEIVYKGEHNHPKPQSSVSLSANLQGRAIISGELGKKNNSQVLNIHPFDQGNLPAGRMDDCSEQISLIAIHAPQLQLQFPQCTLASSRYEDCIIKHPDQVGSRRAGIEIDKLDSRRRKNEDQASIGVSGPHLMMQNLAESTGTYGDGFQWRKYGQKVVKGNAYPRNYYKCTNPNCSMRKYVEKASDDPGSFVTTYEGKHNHEMPITKMKNLLFASDLDAAAAASSKTK